MFKPQFTISPSTAKALMTIEVSKNHIQHSQLSPKAQARLRDTARLFSSHYSTQIEGNKLTIKEAKNLLQKKNFTPGRSRDEREVLGYYRAIEEIEHLALKAHLKIEESSIKKIHALLLGDGKKTVKATSYRTDQNVIKDSKSGKIVYLPPEAKDVPKMMKDLVDWINKNIHSDIPIPIIAGIAHYQFATIHPYYDGNGRTARLLTTLILHLGGYDLRGFYSLEEYYARDLKSYYHAISLGPSHNYYEGRAETDLTPWVEYFCKGMAKAFKDVESRAEQEDLHSLEDKSHLHRNLNLKQRKILDLFFDFEQITSQHIAEQLQIKPRTARDICIKWVKEGFLEITAQAKKSRKYKLGKKFKKLLV